MCKDLKSYDADVECRCGTELEAMGPDVYDDGTSGRLRTGYPPLVTKSTSRCDTKCGNLGYVGGVCISSGVEGTFKNGPADYAKRCKSSKLVSYAMGISGGDSDKTNYDCDPDLCYCYELEKSLSTIEKKIMCVSR